MQKYVDFLAGKQQAGSQQGFEPTWMPDFLYPFQRHLVDWSIRQGRAALFADCGLGKTPMQLVWAQNVVEHTNKPVLILTPLAVSSQTIREAEKFGIRAQHSRDGKWKFSSGPVSERGSRIIVTNYERLHYFDTDKFGGVVCDESSILKNFDGKRKAEITEFMRKRPYRLLCTATAAPNDYDELGTSSEAIGYLGYHDMLGRFFRPQKKGGHHHWSITKYRLMPHAVDHFWRWVCSWSRAIRRPSDYGFDDSDFVLPSLEVNQTVVPCSVPREGMLFVMPAKDLHEQRQERRLTLTARCEKVAELTNGHSRSVAWCHLNDEGDLLAKLIPGAVQISGKDSDESKEEKLLAFSSGQIKRLVTKAKIAGWGLNWQHCSHMTTFPSHSFEQYYQSVRRFLRFGQTNTVHVDIVTTPGEESVLSNLMRKDEQANEMFDKLTANVTNALTIDTVEKFETVTQLPAWI